jgi:hypothetical protein
VELRDLQGDVPPPPHLKARVTDSLRRRGMLRPGRRRWLPLAALLAGVTLLGAGYVMGRGTAPSATRPQPSAADGGRRTTDGAVPYALLLYEDSTFPTTVPEQSLIAEYGAWAREMAARGVLIGGEKLGPTAGRLGAWGRDVEREGLAGFFVIAAPNDSVAVAIANSCPHLRYGGRIVVRRIDPT